MITTKNIPYIVLLQSFEFSRETAVINRTLNPLTRFPSHVTFALNPTQVPALFLCTAKVFGESTKLPDVDAREQVHSQGCKEVGKDVAQE